MTIAPSASHVPVRFPAAASAVAGVGERRRS